ncbi:hypothetical protein [Piscinibacterium candidicorallinum]|uniref:Uncharacterized protein n=1 Tax=Piscinibacterium candidicorallinum TaxID=1793872 RepID=A0ABV7GYJ2_9BURK
MVRTGVSKSARNRAKSKMRLIACLVRVIRAFAAQDIPIFSLFRPKLTGKDPKTAL